MFLDGLPSQCVVRLVYEKTLMCLFYSHLLVYQGLEPHIGLPKTRELEQEVRSVKRHVPGSTVVPILLPSVPVEFRSIGVDFGFVVDPPGLLYTEKEK